MSAFMPDELALTAALAAAEFAPADLRAGMLAEAADDLVEDLAGAGVAERSGDGVRVGEGADSHEGLEVLLLLRVHVLSELVVGGRTRPPGPAVCVHRGGEAYC